MPEKKTCPNCGRVGEPKLVENVGGNWWRVQCKFQDCNCKWQMHLEQTDAKNAV